MEKLLLYFRYISISLKTSMEYRYSFISNMFIQVFTYSINFLGIWVIFNKFNTMNGWSYNEVVFLYSLNLLSYGLSALFVWGPMRQLGNMIQDGSFDGILTRPLNPFYHMLAKNFTYAFLGHTVLAGVVLGISIGSLDISWSASAVVFFILFLLGAFLIQCSMFIIGGALSFWFVNSSQLVDTFIYGIRRFVDYPINLYDTFIRILLTFIVPYAFVNFYPSVYFLNKSGNTLFHPALQYCTPIVGIVLFVLAYRLWSLGIKHYESTGS